MNCEESKELLSIYHDGELKGERRAKLEVHLERCADCSSELGELRKLSATASKLAGLKSPPHLWQRISTSLSGGAIAQEESTEEEQSLAQRTERPEKRPSRRRLLWGVLGTAVVVLIGLGITWSIQFGPHGSHDHDPLREYVHQFRSDPVLAQLRLADEYSGSAVSEEEAIQLVGYRPTNLQPPPEGYTRESLYVLDMPCCKCVEACWMRSDGSRLAIFEHSAGIEDWFKDQPSIRVACGGKHCRLIELGSQFAASWSLGSRIITVIGLRDTDELAELIAAFA